MRVLSLTFFCLCAVSAFAKTEVVAVYYPHWHPYPVGEKIIFGEGKSEWELVRKQKPRYEGHPVPIKPLMGYYDETDPEVVAKEIDLAADAGIDVFLYDWYFYGDRPMMEEALDRGYLKAKNNDRVKFALMWCYHDRRNRFGARPDDPGVWIAKRERTPDEFRRNFAYVLEHYLASPRFWRKDGKPFFSIYDAYKFVADMGGAEKTRALLAEADALATAKGIGPIYWHAMQGTTFDDYARAGFKACSTYNITCHDLKDYETRYRAYDQLFEYADVADAHRRLWKERENLDSVLFIPTVTRGWDCSGRCHPDEPFPWHCGGYPYSGIVRNNTPELFRDLLVDAKAFAETSPKKPEVVILNAWNEYTEGCWLVPDENIGDASLRAVRDVFRPVSFRTPTPVPGVRSLSCRTNVEVRLDAAQTLTVGCDDARAAEWVRTHVAAWFGFEPKVSAAEGRSDLGDEAYRLTAKADGIRIEAKTLQGARYAMYTLRQIAERDSSGRTLRGYRMPELEIADEPAMKFRGIHFCWFPENPASFIEREIRAAAFYKYNYVIIEPWGTYRSERYPWFGWDDAPMDRKEIRRLCGIAADLGVTLVPQINVFGHATGSTPGSQKHAALDFDPALQPLFEPDGRVSGWNWCLSNPDARAVVRELVEEIHEAFGNPPYCHIGCDEADEPSCASCRAVPYVRLIADYISEIAAVLRSRGARTMMWHDMLLDRDDPRWKGFYANGSAETAKLPTLLPKDVIICDWWYGAVRDYVTLDYFTKECGLDAMTCAWSSPEGIGGQAKWAREKKLFGYLQTTWDRYCAKYYPMMLQRGACGAWGDDYAGVSDGHFSLVWRQCGWDMGVREYRDEGILDTQTSRDFLRSKHP